MGIRTQVLTKCLQNRCRSFGKPFVRTTEMDYICTKVPMFSFGRLKNSDPTLGVEMQSTGEVACFGVNQYDAFLKGMIAAGFKLPTKNVLLCIGPSAQKVEFLQWAKVLQTPSPS